MHGISGISEKTARVLTALFFLLLALAGFLTVRDYGMPYDEYTEMAIFHSNVEEYRLHWPFPIKEGYFASEGGQPISQSIEKDHGICAYYPLIPLLPWLRQDINTYSLVWSILTECWFLLGCIAVYGVCRNLGMGWLSSCAAVLLLYLCPRFFAEGHYNNKDVVLLCLFLLTFWQGARLLRKPTLSRGMLLSFFGAMAFNTKIVGIFAWGLMGLAMIVSLTARKKWNRSMVGLAVATILSFVGFYVLLTPALWSDPIGFFRWCMDNAVSFSRFGGEVLFRGARFWDINQETPLPWYYLPFMILVTVPLPTLFLVAAGSARALAKPLRKKTRNLSDPRHVLGLAFLAAFAVPVLYSCVGKPLMYNGWRHFYFVYAGMVLLAAMGLDGILCGLRQRKALRRTAVGLTAGFLALSAVGIALNHPYECAYYNVLIPRDAAETMEMDTWNVCPTGAYRQLLSRTQGHVTIGCYFNDLIPAAYKLPADLRARLTVTHEDDEPYLYYGATYAWVYHAVPPAGYRELFSIKSYGNTVGTVYERVEEP